MRATRESEREAKRKNNRKAPSRARAFYPDDGDPPRLWSIDSKKQRLATLNGEKIKDHASYGIRPDVAAERDFPRGPRALLGGSREENKSRQREESRPCVSAPFF